MINLFSTEINLLLILAESAKEQNKSTEITTTRVMFTEWAPLLSISFFTIHLYFLEHKMTEGPVIC